MHIKKERGFRAQSAPFVYVLLLPKFLRLTRAPFEAALRVCAPLIEVSPWIEVYPYSFNRLISQANKINEYG